MYLYNFNPCCSGRWSHTYIMIDVTFDWECLNPYCSGQWSRTNDYEYPYNHINRES